MIVAQLTIHGGHIRRVNWGPHKFAAVPSPGDLVQTRGQDGKVHYATVRHIEFSAVPMNAVEHPEIIVVADWKSSYDT